MNQEALIIIGYIVSFCALALCGISIYKEIFKHSTFILFAVCIVALALTTYINSDYVEISQIGDQAALGQFGDFVGGILNPIFGFLTVVLLLLTLNHEKKSNNSTELKNQIILYESIINNRLKELEDILKTEALHDLHNEFHDYHSHQPDTFYITDVNPKALNDSKRITIGRQAENIFLEEQAKLDSRSSVTNSYNLNNYNVIWRARKAIKDIRDVTVELVTISNDKFYKKYQYNKYYEFVMENSSYGLIAVQELPAFSKPMEHAYS